MTFRCVEPGDVVMLADDREGIVTARVEAEPGDRIRAFLEVAALVIEGAREQNRHRAENSGADCG